MEERGKHQIQNGSYHSGEEERKIGLEKVTLETSIVSTVLKDILENLKHTQK